MAQLRKRFDFCLFRFGARWVVGLWFLVPMVCTVSHAAPNRVNLTLDTEEWT